MLIGKYLLVFDYILNQSLQSFSLAHDALVESLAYSGLGITSETTFAEMAEILATEYPATLSMIRSGWTVSESNSYGNQAYTSTSSSVKLISRANDTDYSVYSYLTSPEFDIDKFKTLSVYGTSYKYSSNTSGTSYCPTLYLVDGNGNRTQLWQHANVNSTGSLYTINFTKDVSALTGKYRLQIQTMTYSDNTSYNNNVHAYMELTKALLSA